MDNPKPEHKPLNFKNGKKKWSSRFSSNSFALVIVGSIILGFIIAWQHGGFPSILLPSFAILAIGILGDIFKIISKPEPKLNIEPVKPLRGILFFVVFYLIFAWLFAACLPFFGGEKLNNVLRKVEFPFSEASHVVADSKGSVYVYSQFNKRIQKYSKEGRFQFGWFASKWKNSEISIDEEDFIYTYGDHRESSNSITLNCIVRKYDSNGNLINEVIRGPQGSGWWRLKDGSVEWDPNAHEPRGFDLYNTAVKETELLPASELSKWGGGSGKAAFKTEDSKYYKLTKLWFVFPVVSVGGPLSKVETHIMPNPLSSAFTFVFPGFLFYMLTLFVGWLLEKRAERLTKPFLLKCAVTFLVIVISFAAIAVGSKLVMTLANALPDSNPMHFWLIPIVVIPYWIVVIMAALWTWRSLIRRLDKIGLADGIARNTNPP